MTWLLWHNHQTFYKIINLVYHKNLWASGLTYYQLVFTIISILKSNNFKLGLDFSKINNIVGYSI